MPDPGKDSSNRWVLLPALAVVVCCAGPVLFTALGAGSVGALIGGATGSTALLTAGVLLAAAAGVMAFRRRRKRSPRGQDDE